MIIFVVIECCYYSLSTHKVISALYYYRNLYTKLNDVIITCIYASRGGARAQDLGNKLRFYLLYN